MKVGIASALFQCFAFPCVHGCLQGVQNGNFPPPGHGTKTQTFLENLKSVA